MAKEYIERREGGYYIAGTRISLDSVIYGFSRGESAETICQNFDLLRLEEVYGAIAYYLANREACDKYLKQQEAKWASGRSLSTPLPSELRSRLLRARDELHSSRSS